MQSESQSGRAQGSEEAWRNNTPPTEEEDAWSTTPSVGDSLLQEQIEMGFIAPDRFGGPELYCLVCDHWMRGVPNSSMQHILSNRHSKRAFSPIY